MKMNEKTIVIAGVLIALAILLDGYLDRRAREAELQACIESIQEAVGYATADQARLSCLRVGE